MKTVTFRRTFLLAMAVPCGFAPAYANGVLFEPRVSFASDAQVGARLGYHGLYAVIPGTGSLEAFLDLDGRLLPHTVRERVSPTFSYQYRERRWGVGAGISHVIKVFPLDLGHSWALVTGAGAGWSFADYRGTRRAPETGWVGWGEFGFRYDAGDAYWGAGVQVKPLPSVFPLRLHVQTGWRF